MAEGSVSLEPSAPARYAVHGPRDDKPFADCRVDSSGNTVCTTLMVHRFSIACAGGVVPWVRVVHAARGLGVSVPGGMPRDYAPITLLNARLVLPALARFSPHEDAVASEPLHAEAVVYRGGDLSEPPAAGTWSTIVTAELRPDVSGNALRVSGIVGVLLAAFLTLGLFAARQPTLDLERGALSAFRRGAGWFARSFSSGFARLLPDPQSNEATAEITSLLNAVSIATARLAETELAVAALPRVLSLRDVLEGELDAARVRVGEITKALNTRPRQKSAAMVRTVMRDLDRIARIAQGAFRDTSADSVNTATLTPDALPESLKDAYRVLGLNGDAAPNVAKKLVDALRMTWHPDFARDEEDRRLREARMKQINAAWDIIKSRTAQAA